jgi:hypothetical protein
MNDPTTLPTDFFIAGGTLHAAAPLFDEGLAAR